MKILPYPKTSMPLILCKNGYDVFFGIAFDEEDHGDQASIYFPDPAGNVLEITAPPTTVVHEANAEALAVARRWIAGA